MLSCLYCFVVFCFSLFFCVRFDPANPGGNILRDDLFANLLQWEESTDLCLALGTSLSGLNADRIATTPARKYPAGGLIIVSLQATRLDDISTLRIFAPLNDVMTLLVEELELPDMPEPMDSKKGEINADVFTLPYDHTTGKPSKTKSCTLNLTEGAKIKVLEGNFAGCNGVVGPKTKQGHYNLKILQPVEDMPDVVITNEHLLGKWWLGEAARGLVSCLPVVQA